MPENQGMISPEHTTSFFIKDILFKTNDKTSNSEVFN